MLTAAISAVTTPARPGRAQPPAQRNAGEAPVAVWPSGPLDVIAAFASPIDGPTASALVGQDIPYFDPAPNVAGRASATVPLGSLHIVGVQLGDDGRTLKLATDPHPRQARYVLPLKFLRSGGFAANAGYSLAGVEAAWTKDGADADPEPAWTLWWPSLDTDATLTVTKRSKPPETAWADLARPGRLVLTTLIRFTPGDITLRVESSEPIEEAILGEAVADLTPAPEGQKLHVATLKSPARAEPLFFSITCRTGQTAKPLALKTTFRLNDDKPDRTIGGEQLTLPWAPPLPASTPIAAVPDLAGGDPVRGRAVFYGEQSRCSQCHAVRGEGGKIGPDLTDISKKSRAEIYRSIAAPSDAIEPEFLSYTVATRAGQVMVGVVRAEGADAIRVTDTNARVTQVTRAQIQQIRPSANSIMPVGLTGVLGEPSVRDLIAFLTAKAP
jgi:putative heme-binding domain-containing protein